MTLLAEVPVAPGYDLRLLREDGSVFVEILCADDPPMKVKLPSGAPDEVRMAVREGVRLAREMEGIDRYVAQVQGWQYEVRGLKVERGSRRMGEDGMEQLVRVQLEGDVYPMDLHVGAEHSRGFGDVGLTPNMLRSLRVWVDARAETMARRAAQERPEPVPRLERGAARGRPGPTPRPAKGAPTALNLYAMSSVLKEHGGVIPDRVPPTDLPHLRRCIAAGLLERGPAGGWVPTAAGREALAAQPAR